MSEDRRYWEPEIETASPEKLREIQLERLQSLVARAYEKTALYRRKFDQAGLKPGDIKTLDDLRKLPLTDYLEDFCKTPIPEKLAVPMEEVKFVNSTSGTLSGFTQPFLLTENEFEVCLQGVSRIRWAMGVRPEDVVQPLVASDLDRRSFTTIGATLLFEEAGRYNLDQQIGLTKVMNVTVIGSLPSLVLRYFERARELGIDIRETKLRLVLCGGEGWAEAYKKKVEAEYGLSFRTMYGAVEIPFVATECEEEEGMHILSDYVIVEVIDPETKEVLGPGEEGELVVTALTSEAMPLIRYRMGDVASILPYGHCPCGRTHPKLSTVKGRVAHTIRIKGKKLFPIDVEEVIAGTPGLGDDYLITLDQPGEHERLKVKAEYRPEVSDLKTLKRQVEERIDRDLGVDSEVELVPMGTLGRPMFKAQRVINNFSSH